MPPKTLPLSSARGSFRESLLACLDMVLALISGSTHSRAPAPAAARVPSLDTPPVERRCTRPVPAVAPARARSTFVVRAYAELVQISAPS